jgi:hypothetical protein
MVPAAAAGEHFQMANSIYFSDGGNTSARLTNTGEHIWATGTMLKYPSVKTVAQTLQGGEYTEIEYNLNPADNAIAGQAYCFRITDNGTALNSYNTYPILTIAPPPSSSFISANQKNDGSGIVDAAILVDDGHRDQLIAKIEYEVGASCSFTDAHKATINETDSNTTATYGDPKIDNDYAYQIGTTSGMIITSFGANTVNFDWNANLDVPGVDGIYCIRSTVTDGFDVQIEPATTTLVLDQINPTTPGNLTKIDFTTNSVTVGFGTSSADTNFKEYKIFYKEGSSGVTESDSLFGSSSDVNLSFADFSDATTTTIAGLSVNKQYVFNIWAYDDFGNKSVAGEELVVIIRYIARSENWRWYIDRQNETPTVALSEENSSPSAISPGSIFKLRVALREKEGITGEDIKMRLQYSTFSDFSADVHYVGEKNSSEIWTYGDGVDSDNDPIIEPLLSGVGLGATHNESGISTTTFDHLGDSLAEWEFTLRNNDAVNFITYYFRVYNETNNEPVLKNIGEYSYPNLVTAEGDFTYSISGISAGSNIEGVLANITTSPTTVPFGTLGIAVDAIAAQRFVINTNAGGGYQLFSYQKQGMISNNGAYVYPIEGTNENPISWAINTNPSAFGYHSGDESLSGSLPSRFAPDNTYAQFETQMKEIAFSPIPVQNESIDLVFRAKITDLQDAGDYQTSIVYILVPIFY